MVEKGEIKWDDDDNWEVERILDHVEEEVNSLTTDSFLRSSHIPIKIHKQ